MIGKFFGAIAPKPPNSTPAPRTLFAFSNDGLVPSFTSLNHHDGGAVVLTVRGAGIGGAAGPLAEIELPIEKQRELHKALGKHLDSVEAIS